MADREHSSKGFLERWSRKKIDAERDEADAAAEPHAADMPLPDALGSPERSAEVEAKAAVPAAPKPEFDLTSLPSLELITAATDIRAFLSPGVPKELARAALRRAWSADPAIRDFVGLAENAWDFTDPAAMPGFGALPEGTDIKKMLAQIFGDGDKPDGDDTTASQPADREENLVAEEIAPTPSPGEALQQSASEVASGPKPPARDHQFAQSDFVHRDSNDATHNNSSDDEINEHKQRRHHGGALPQ